MIQYILECIAFQLVFLIIYDLFLKKETFFQWNRLYLIGTYILSLVIPWIKIEAMKTSVPEAFQDYPEFLWNLNDTAVIAAASNESSFNISWEYGAFFGGVFLATLLFAYKLYQINRLKRKETKQTFHDFTQYIILNSNAAFSFFRSVFLGDKILEREHQSIVQHELVHIRQRHSYDLIFFELMRIVGWFNPLVYVYQSRVSELHEFIADAHVAKTHKKEQYQLLLSKVFQTQNISFINQFFKTSLIKKRIVMLQKVESKRIFKLKYLLLVPLVFGMLAYTSSNFQENGILSQETTKEDALLIAEIENEIEKQIIKEGTLMKVYFASMKQIRSNENQILSKKDYFKKHLLQEKYFKTIKVEFGDDVQPRPTFVMPLPSTSRYESYVRRKEAFYILDQNLQFSIKAYEQQVELIDTRPNYSSSSYLFEVENVKDLTGNEVRSFNNILTKIFESDETIYRDLILTDKTYVFRVYTGTPKRGMSSYENSNIQGLVERSDKKITLNVYDSKHLSKGEKAQQEAFLNEIRNSTEIDTLVVTDAKYSSKIISSSNGSTLLKFGEQSDPVPFATVDEVPIFPGCEDAENMRKCFNDKMQQHISKNFNYPKEAQEKGIQGRVNVIFSISKKGKIEGLRMRGPDSLLEKEVARIINRLPKMKPGKHKGKAVDVPFSIPVVFKLKSEDVFEKLSENSNHSNPAMAASIKQYNQLVEERKRLLKSSNEKNPIIINLDQQLNQLKLALNESLRSSLDNMGQESESANGVHNSKGGAISQYNQLVAERQRLLKSSNEKNPIIVNLEQQIKALKKAIDQESETVPFAQVDKVPLFPGCEDDENKRACFSLMMQKHIAKNFNYPKEAQEKGIQGRVSILFTITQDGNIENVKMRGPDKLLEKEVARIIGRLPKMTPGEHKGKAVDVPFSIPITFKLQGNDEEAQKIELKNITDRKSLVVIDGKESFNYILYSLNPDDIKSMTVLKSEEAQKKYGKKGRHGVIEVVTKKDKKSAFKFLNNVENKPDPLVFIDREEATLSELQSIDQSEIASMLVLKDASSISKYGERGKHGVIEIITKKADKEKLFFNPNKPDPYIIIDDKEASKEELEKLEPDEIANMNVLKEEAAEKKYGEKGKNGVIEIETKKED